MSDAGDQIGSDQVVDLHRGPVIRATEIGKSPMALVSQSRLDPEVAPANVAIAVTAKPVAVFMLCIEGIRVRGRTLVAPVAAAAEQIERARAIANVMSNSGHCRSPRMKGSNERGCPALGSVIPWSELSADTLQFGLGDRGIRLIRRNIRVGNNCPVFIGARAADDADVGLQLEQAALE